MVPGRHVQPESQAPPVSPQSQAVAARGAAAAALSFFIWGLWPLFWKQLHAVSPFELIAHRVVWSLLLLLGIQLWQGSLPGLRAAAATSPARAGAVLCGLLLAVNWTIYVWAVNAGHVIDSSLGYFLTPLLNVLLGHRALKERLYAAQWAAVGCAAAGVGLLLTRTDHLPWIALSLAATWSTYGFLKKRSSLGPIPGLTLETLVVAPFAVAVLWWRTRADLSVFTQPDLPLIVLALATGPLTTCPLLLFAYGAKRIRLATLGLLQYIAPSVQFLLGWWVYGEPLDRLRLWACVLIWCGLVIFTIDSFRAQHSRTEPVVDI
jgi:chloramphenicol-sensitive protein RarD